MSGARRALLLLGIMAAILMACGGCAYLKDRGNDALDIFDVGMTFTKEPRVGIYAGFQSLLAAGYANVDGWMAGVGNRHAGWLDMRYHAAGCLLEGYEQWGFDGDYDPADEGSPTKRGIGVGLIYGGYPTTVVKALNCPKFLHVGFIGVNVNCKIAQALDFVLGWTTLDIGLDDECLGQESVPAEEDL